MLLIPRKPPSIWNRFIKLFLTLLLEYSLLVLENVSWDIQRVNKLWSRGSSLTVLDINAKYVLCCTLCQLVVKALILLSTELPCWEEAGTAGFGIWPGAKHDRRQMPWRWSRHQTGRNGKDRRRHRWDTAVCLVERKESRAKCRAQGGKERFF